jgi:outer membrane protein TolC
MMRIFSSILLLLCWIGIAAAEPVRLSIKEAVIMAAGTSNMVKAEKFRLAAAQCGVDLAGSQYLPRLGFEEAFAASNSPTQTFMMKLDEGRFAVNDLQISNLNNPGTQHDFKTALVLTQPLFDPAIAPSREIAVKQAESQSMSLETTRQEMAFAAFRLYLDIQKAQAQVRAAETALGESRENLRLAKVRTENGVGLKSDELRARTHQALMEQNLITEKNTLSLARMQLEKLLGFKDGENLEVDEAISVVSPPPGQNDLVTTALENRSDLLQMKSEQEKANAGVRLARNSYLPSVGAFASYQLNSKDTPFGADNNSWMAGATLKWQIFDGFARSSEYRRAVANRSASSEYFDNQIKEVVYSVKESLLKHDEAGKRLEVAKNTVQDAEETVRLISRRYENSLATMYELLDAQTVLNQARAGMIDNETNFALASGQIYHAAGMFLKEMSK